MEPSCSTARGVAPRWPPAGGAAPAWVLVALLSLACVTPPYLSRNGRLWHPRQPVGVPDLSERGWQRVGVDGADLAFRREGDGVIAVRVRCPAPDGQVPLRWEARRLWLGVPRDEIERQPLDVDGYPGVHISSSSRELHLRTLVVRTEACSLDVAQVAPLASPHAAVFEEFVSGIRLRGVGP